MTISVLQENGTYSTSTFTTVTINLPGVTAASSLHALVYSGSGNAVTVSDGVNTWSGALDSIGGSAHYIANNVAAGSTTVSATSSPAGANWLAIWVREIGATSGLDATSGGHNSLETPTASIVTNALLGAALTPASAPGLLSSYALWLSGSSNFGSDAAVEGTGFTAGVHIFGTPSAEGASESLRYVATTSQRALWTANFAQDYVVYSAFFVESGPPPPPPVLAFGPMPKQLYVMP